MRIRPDLVHPAVGSRRLLPGRGIGELRSPARSALTLFRGTPHVMAQRLARTSTRGTMVQLNGDATLSNFGVYRASDGQLVFDFAEFDQTHPGPWEWDLRRLAADLAVAGRSSGFTATQRRRAVVRSARRYAEAMRLFADMSSREVLRARADLDEVRRQYDFGRAARWVTDRAVWPQDAVPAGTADAALIGPPWFPAAPGRGTPSHRLTEAGRDRLEALRGLVEGYTHTLLPEGRSLLKEYELIDVARTAGRGPERTRRSWLLLLTARSGGEPLVLEATRAPRCALEGVAGLPQAPGLPAERMARGRRLMQERPDRLIGWHRLENHQAGRGDYEVHQACHRLVSDSAVRIGSFSMSAYAELCAWTLAHAHARTGDRRAIAAQLSAEHWFEQDLAEFSERYADQNDCDHRRLVAVVGERTRPMTTSL